MPRHPSDAGFHLISEQRFHKKHAKNCKTGGNFSFNRAASNFGSTVLEAFYELSKILEISTRSIGKVHVSEIAHRAAA